MRYVCDAPRWNGSGRTWFQLETEAEADAESDLMEHAVSQFFVREWAAAGRSYTPPDANAIERDVGLKDHIARSMPIFLTLRDDEGRGLATAMLPPAGRPRARFRIVIVGHANSDPYPEHGDAIEALGEHYGLNLPRRECYPYGGG